MINFKVLVTLSAIFLFAWLDDAHADKNTQRNFRVGVIAAQTGPAAWWGENIFRGVKLAAEEQGANPSVTFLYEDDAFSAKNAVTAATKLINEDNVDAIITFSGGPTAAVAEITERRNIPLIGISGSDAFTTGRKFAYRLFISNDGQIDLLTKEAEKRNLQKIALIATSQESMLHFQKLFTAKNSGKIVLNEEVSTSDNDMNSLATKIMSKRPDGVLLFVNPPQLSALSRALRAQGFTQPFLGGVNASNPSEIRASQGALLGAMFPAPSGQDAAAFLEKLKKSEKLEDASSECLYGYDAAKILIEAAHSGDLANFLANSKEQHGLSGVYPRAGQSFDVPVRLKTILADDGTAR